MFLPQTCSLFCGVVTGPPHPLASVFLFAIPDKLASLSGFLLCEEMLWLWCVMRILERQPSDPEDYVLTRKMENNWRCHCCCWVTVVFNMFAVAWGLCSFAFSWIPTTVFALYRIPTVVISHCRCWAVNSLPWIGGSWLDNSMLLIYLALWTAYHWQCPSHECPLYTATAEVWET